MSKRLHRLTAILLSLVMLFQTDFINIFAENGIYNTAVENVGVIDFSTHRLLIGTDDPSIFSDNANVLRDYGGVYLLGFEDEADTASAYTYYSGAADFVDADIAMYIADDDFIAESQAKAVEAGINASAGIGYKLTKSLYDVAIIDTGVANGAATSVSVIGGDGVDDNGHGTAMLDAVKSVSDTVSVLSVKAFDADGTAYLSDIYAAMRYAIEKDVHVISMSFASERKTSGGVLRHALAMAKEAGIIVVGAAGNAGADVSGYLPGHLDGILIAGACDKYGVKLSDSNYGENVLCNVVADSTSEASAKLAAMIAVYGEDCISTEMNGGVIFAKDYSRPEEEIAPDMLIMDGADGEVAYEKHYQLTQIEPANNMLLQVSNLAGKAPAVLSEATDESGDIDKGSNIYTSHEGLPGTDPDHNWSAPPVQEPVSGENITIEKVYIRWLSASDGADSAAYFGLLDLQPETDDVKNQQFQIDFALSGQTPYEPGMIQLVFPAYLWLDRDGNEPGYLTMSVPEDPDDNAEFVWRREGDNIIVTNVKTMSAASKVMIQGTFRGLSAHDMVNGTLSDELHATVSVITPQGHTVSMESNSIYAHIDTSVEVSYASKTAYNSVAKKYDVWWESVPSDIPPELLANLPENTLPDDYGYVRWYVSGEAQGNQPFNMYINDSVPDNDPYGTVMLGVTGAFVTEDNPTGTYPSADGKTVEALLFSGYNTEAKAAYVWTAYPKEKIPQDHYIDLPNTQTITVTGWDDGITTEKSASATIPTKLPTTYTFIKYWDDNDNEAGNRPGSLGLRITRSGYTGYWRTETLTERDSTDDESVTENRNHWTYQWSDGGQPDSFSVSEQLYNASGFFDERFDDTGHRLSWQYHLTNTHYDNETHTWTYTNSYTEGWIQFELSHMNKTVEYMFSDNAQISDRDNQSINKLPRGEEVRVKYPVSATISVAEQSEWHHIKPNLFVLEDVEYILNGNYSLTAEDVDIGAVILSKPTLWDYLEDSYDEVTGWYDREEVDPEEPPELYGMREDGTWVLLATLDGDVVTPVEQGVTVSGMRVDLPSGIVRVKLQLTADIEIVKLGYTVELRVYPTDSVNAMIENGFEISDYLRLPLYNKANAYAEYAGEGEKSDGHKSYKPGDRIIDMEDIATGYMHGRQFKVAASLQKDFKVEESDPSARRVRLSSALTLIQQSNVLSEAEYLSAIKAGEIPNTRSGIYYDLLPYGVDPVVESIQLSEGDTLVDAYTINDYRGTGRTMLVAIVNLSDHITRTYKTDKKPFTQQSYPTEGYKNTHTLTFDSYISWDIILGSTVPLSEYRNIAAYEADEEWIGSLTDWSGEPDDPGYGNHILSPDAVYPDADLMTGLDANRDPADPSFVYAGTKLDTSGLDFSAAHELQKLVQAAGSGVWSDGSKNDVNVQEGGAYTYRLLISSFTDTYTKNMILLDSLENYIPNEEDKDFGQGQWRGTLRSIDLNQIIEAGVAPVVYLSTVVGIDLSQPEYNQMPSAPGNVLRALESLTESDGSKTWLKVTNLAELPEIVSQNNITAIAIDMTKGTDGEEFVLEPNKALTVDLYMRAPFSPDDEPDYFNGTDGTKHTQNWHAFNNVYLDATTVSVGRNTHSYIHQDYTKVGIYTQSIEVEKVWDDAFNNDGKRPGSITVRLLANGVDTHKTVTLSDYNDWKATFERLLTYDDDGNYIVYTYKEEFTGSEDYELTIDRTVDKDGTVHIKLINKREPEKIKLPVTKLWEGDEDNQNGTRPAYITVRLYADGVFTGKRLTIRPDANGKWYGEFTDLNRYRDHGIEIVYTIEEEDVDDYVQVGEPTKTADGYDLLNRYKPTGELSVKKLLEDATDAAAEQNEFTFWLRLKTADGGTVTDRYPYTIYDKNGNKTDRTGMIGDGNSFTLKGGEYILIEDIPTHLKYTVSEDKAKAFELTGMVGETGEIISWSPAQAEFTNTYVTRGSVQLEAFKLLTGRPLSARRFRFEIWENDTRIRTAYNDADGKVTFGQINYTNADIGKTFTYTVKEYIAGHDGYIYDDTSYTVTVVPKDNGDGTISCEVNYFDAAGNPLNIDIDGMTYHIPVFKNEYHAQGSLAFRAWKVLDGRGVKDGEFAFDLYDEHFQYLQTACNDGSGLIDFESLAYTEVNAGKTYWYYVREQQGGDPTVVYAKTILGYRVTVVDNGNGTLSFNQAAYNMTEAFTECEICGGTGKIDKTDCGECHGFGSILDADWTEPEIGIIPVFNNGLADGSLSVSKYIGNGNSDQEFHFKVKLIGSKVEDRADLHFTIDTAPERAFPDLPGAGSGGVNSSENKLHAIAAEAKTAMLFPSIVEIPDGANAVAAGPVMTIAEEAGEVYIGPTELDGIIWTLYYNSDNRSTYTLSVEPNPDSDNPGRLNLAIGAAKSAPWYSYIGSVTRIETDNVIHLFGQPNYLLYNAKKLTDISGLANWDVSEVKSMTYFFYGCEKLTDISYLKDWDVSNVTTMVAMFLGCNQLSELTGLEEWDVRMVEQMTSIFSNCTGLSNISALEKWQTDSLKKFDMAFYNCIPLTDINPLANWNMANVSTFSETFNLCENLSDISASAGWNTDSLTSLSKTFRECTNLSDISALAKWNTENVYNLSSMFYNCKKLSDASPLAGWNTEKVSNISNMFYGCSALKAADFRNWNTAKITSSTNLSSFLGLCPSLSKITFGPDFFNTAFTFSFPTPSPATVYTGRWVLEDEVDWPNAEHTYLPSELNGVEPGTYVWQPLPTAYTVIFEANGGAGSMLSDKAAAKGDYAIPRNGFVMPGKTVVAWQDKAHTNEPKYYFALNRETGVAIIPAGTYAAGDVVVLIPVWDEVDTSYTITDGEFDFWLRGGERATFDGIPAGTSYQVWEETPDGWVLIQQEGTSGVIEPLETARAAFFNLYQPDMTAASIIGTKLLDNRAADSDANGDPFVFELYEILPSGSEKLVDEVEVQPGGFIRFNTLFYEESDIGTHTYIVREKRGNNPDIQYDSHEETVTVTVEKVGESLTSTVTYEQNRSAVSFANLTKPGILEISKVGDGLTDKNKDAEFVFRVKFYNENGTPIDSGSFPWYVKNTATGEIVNYNAASNAAIDLYQPIDGIISSAKAVYASPAVDHGDIVGSGSTGTITWIVYSDGTLSVEPTTGNECTWTLNFGSPPWNSYKTSIKSVETNGTIHFSGNVGYLFYDHKNLTDISGLANWDMSGAKALSNHGYLHVYGLFEGCSKLSDLTPLANWNVGKSEYFQRMFYGCSSITDLTPLANWNVSSAIDMGGMFYRCTGLETLSGLEKWDVSGLKTTFEKNSGSSTYHGMFRSCTMLKDISALSDWDVSKVQSFQFMFAECSALTDLTPLSKWTVTGATSMAAMFYNCSAIERLSGLENWKPTNVTVFAMQEGSIYYGMFQSCTKLTDITALTTWNVSSASNMQNLFRSCSLLSDISPLGGWNPSSLTNLSGIFYGCNIKDASALAGWRTPELTNMSEAFYSNKNLEIADFSNWDTSKITSATNIKGFLGRGDGKYSLKEITFGEKFFNFASNNSYDPTAGNLGIPALPTDRTTGYWINENEQGWNPATRSVRYTSAELSAGVGIEVPVTYVWEYLAPYTVTFQSNGGSGSMLDITGLVYEDLVLPNNQFVRLGYIFDGWQATAVSSYAESEEEAVSVPVTYDKTTGTYKIAVNACRSGDIVTLTPIWKASGESGVPYYVYRYQQNTSLNGYTLAEISVRYAEPGEEVLITANQYPGFITPQSVRETIPEDSVLYVYYYYDRVRYTLHFDPNGAEYGEMNDIQMIGGIAQRLPGCGFSKTGCLFIDWNTDPNGEGEPYTVGQSVNMVAENGQVVTLYAQWMSIGQSTQPSSGEIIVKCKAGQTIVIPDLPAGTTYEIEEIAVPYGWSVTKQEGVEGTIRSNSTSSAQVTNSYRAIGYASIPVHKKLVGDTLNSGAFEFGLYPLAYSHTPNISNSGVQKGYYENNSRQRDVVTLTGAKSLHVKVTVQTETNYDYLHIWEGKYEGTIAKTVTGALDSLGGSSLQTKEYDIPGDTVTFGFYSDASNNSYYGYYAIVTGEFDEPFKTAVNGDVDTVTDITDENGNTAPNPWYGWASAVFDGLEFTEPGEYTYYIREKVLSDPSVTYDEHIEFVTIVVTDNGDGTLATELRYDTKEGAPFENHMNAGELTVAKTLQNAVGSVIDKSFEFRIELKDASGNPLTGKYPVVKSNGLEETLTVENGVGNTISIKGGETFTVKDLPHGAQYTVTEVQAHNFELVASDGLTGTIEGGNAYDASFTNVYAASAPLPLILTKEFLGGNLEDNTFYFELLSEEGEVLQKVAAKADGTIEFNLDFTQDDVGKTYTYQIREAVEEGEELDGVLYDTHTETIQVSVENDTDGNLILTVDKDTEELIFSNVALFDMEISKRIAGLVDPTEAFGFTLTLENEDYDLSDITYTKDGKTDLLSSLRSAESGQYEFTLRHGETIKLNDLPYGTTYTVKETATGYMTQVTTTMSGEETVVEGREIEGTLSADTYIEYVNAASLELPDTGGTTTAPFALFGCALILTAVWLFIYGRRYNHG